MLVLELHQGISIIGEILFVEKVLSDVGMWLFECGLRAANTGCERFLGILRGKLFDCGRKLLV